MEVCASVPLYLGKGRTPAAAVHGRYNELLLAGLAVPLPASPVRGAALLEAQDDAATRRFAEAAAAGLSVTRVFAAGGDYQNIVLQPFPGGSRSKCV